MDRLRKLIWKRTVKPSGLGPDSSRPVAGGKEMTDSERERWAKVVVQEYGETLIKLGKE